ncbi:hypothetical protein QJS10_CPB11g02393 [Acorus calamus]|uniref:RNase H type-1 domain-containing protein n=1 Tax=Acorus calamus TaxID=4465 RepID=A0AAV9DY21_ACOCL|nr:hypothetical protein QJS10_CPB11g02393 [Acorus calamus]
MHPNSCWALFMDTRYLHRQPIWDAKPARGGSCIWKSLKGLQHFLKDGTRWVVGNGESISFWMDKWLGNQPLYTLFPHLANNFLKVNWIINESGNWDLSHVHDLDLLNTLREVRLLPHPNLAVCDSMGWEDTDLGPATVKSCWNSIRTSRPKVNWASLVWHPILPPRVSLFAWRAFHHRTPTDEWASRRGFSLASRCHLCYQHSEDECHLFFGCPATSPVWNQLVAWTHSTPPRQQPIAAALKQWVASITLPRTGRFVCKVLFLLCVFEIWKARNDAKFNGNPPNTPHIINNIRRSMRDAFSIHGSKWQLDPQSIRLVNSLGIPSTPTPPTPPIEVKWIKPKPPWIKCNIDGASKGNPGPSGAGGLFRDHNGRFLLGFACNTKRNTNMFAEFFALYRGLMIWLDTHPHFTGPLWIESDSLVVVNTILEKASATPRIKHLVEIIHSHLRTLSLWHISHVFREGNRVADKLANLAIVEPTEAIWNSPPASIVPFLNDDANEVPQHRFPKGS